MRSSLWTWPTVENPRDLWLQADLTRKLQRVNSKNKINTAPCFFFPVIFYEPLIYVEGTVAERVTGEAQAVAQAISGTYPRRVTKEGDAIHYDRLEAGIKGAPNVRALHCPAQMVPRKTRRHGVHGREDCESLH